MSDIPETIHPTRSVATPVPRRRWVRLILWCIIFGSGFVAGTGLTLIAVRQGMLQAVHHPEAMPAKLANRLRRPLSLDDRQVDQITGILRQRQRALEQIRGRIQPELIEELDALDEQIAGVLNADQRERWNTLSEKLRATWIPPMPANNSPNAAPSPDSGQP